MWEVCVLQYRLHNVDDLDSTINRNRNFSPSHHVQPDPWPEYPNLLVGGNQLCRNAQNKKVISNKSEMMNRILMHCNTSVNISAHNPRYVPSIKQVPTTSVPFQHEEPT